MIIRRKVEMSNTWLKEGKVVTDISLKRSWLNKNILREIRRVALTYQYYLLCVASF